VGVPRTRGGAAQRGRRGVPSAVVGRPPGGERAGPTGTAEIGHHRARAARRRRTDVGGPRVRPPRQARREGVLRPPHPGHPAVQGDHLPDRLRLPGRAQAPAVPPDPPCRGGGPETRREDRPHPDRQPGHRRLGRGLCPAAGALPRTVLDVRRLRQRHVQRRRALRPARAQPQGRRALRVARVRCGRCPPAAHLRVLRRG
jgi:hypothetical protein